jgi:transcriptional regulator with XRE-family HTH domain
MTFGEKLKELRDGRGWTQTDLAVASGVTLGSIRDYEQGKSEPGFRALFRIAGALGVDCTAFAGCDGQDKATEPPRLKGRPRKAGAAGKPAPKKRRAK